MTTTRKVRQMTDNEDKNNNNENNIDDDVDNNGYIKSMKVESKRGKK